MIPSEIPTNLVGLFITLVMGLLVLLAEVVRRILSANITFQNRIVESQVRIVKILDGHLDRISEHMTKNNTALDLIVSRLLDAALRKPIDNNDQDHNEMRE